MQGATLHQHGGDGPATAVKLCLDDGALGRTLRIGLEIQDFRLERDGLEQPVEVELLGRRDLDIEYLATQRLDLHLVLEQFGAHAFRLRIGPIDLVDRDNHRHFRRFGVIYRLDRLRHDAVVGGDHQHDGIRHLGTACTHGAEGGVARRVDERDLVAGRRSHLVGADVLGDAASFACRHIGRTNRIEQRSLAVIDVAHDRHHRRARQRQIVLLRRRIQPPA